ncbi:hypothetical protein VQ056_23810 [Paenibacillus sp. JTLBN-2024]
MHDKRFDPTLISRLDNPERRKKLPPEELLALLELKGGEDILDVGAGAVTLRSRRRKKRAAPCMRWTRNPRCWTIC